MKRYDYKFNALWTICLISIVSNSNTKLRQIVNIAYEIIKNFENDFSRFKNDSMLSRLNETKSLEVSEEFLFLLERSRQVYNISNWYYNPLVNLKTIWYTNSFEKNDFIISQTSENLDFENIKIYWNLVELEGDMNIDFWSIAKWFLVDKITNFLHKKKLSNFLVNFWWDIYASGLNQYAKPWNIWIMSPFNNKENIYNTRLSNKSISTSGTYHRKWEIDSEIYTHIKNPKWEIDDKLLSVSLIWNKTYKTDAFATAVLSMWQKKWLEFCEKNNLDYVFINSNWDIFLSETLK